VLRQSVGTLTTCIFLLRALFLGLVLGTPLLTLPNTACARMDHSLNLGSVLGVAFYKEADGAHAAVQPKYNTQAIKEDAGDPGIVV
jgi:hypothetical protein